MATKSEPNYTRRAIAWGLFVFIIGGAAYFAASGMPADERPPIWIAAAVAIAVVVIQAFKAVEKAIEINTTVKTTGDASVHQETGDVHGDVNTNITENNG